MLQIYDLPPCRSGTTAPLWESGLQALLPEAVRVLADIHCLWILLMGNPLSLNLYILYTLIAITLHFPTYIYSGRICFFSGFGFV